MSRKINSLLSPENLWSARRTGASVMFVTQAEFFIEKGLCDRDEEMRLRGKIEEIKSGRCELIKHITVEDFLSQ